jgi:hypothetical protein
MGKFVQPSARRVMLSELYANVLEDYQINHHASIEDLEDRWVKHLQPFFGHMAAAEVNDGSLQEVLRSAPGDGSG